VFIGEEDRVTVLTASLVELLKEIPNYHFTDAK
jgi:hypothetical protein